MTGTDGLAVAPVPGAEQCDFGIREGV